jgi:CheY-like chemotaxis protein
VPEAQRALILLADDNADMREYLARLMTAHYRVEVVADGEAALNVVARRLPSLVLSDVMMPRITDREPKPGGVPAIGVIDFRHEPV